MNTNLYRLVFNKRLGMYVPTHEGAKSRSKGGGTGGGSSASSRPSSLGTLLAAGMGLGIWMGTAQAQLPVACGGGPCGSNPNPTAFVTSGAAGYAVSGNQAVVTQTTNKAILNWQSFDIGAGNTLTYRYQDGSGSLPANASFSSLNRIWQANPSEIAGRIQVQPGQNAQITLINQNGILFKDGAQVSVGSLTASTLDITDAAYLAGVHANANAGGQAAFAAGASAPGGLVVVESGAELKTERGGRVMLLAENVENHGLIETPEGQTILAAGAKVYLAVSDDPGLRGFLVEVDSPASGGTALNTGTVIADRGNISMTGLTVNQAGRLTATTSVNLNGSIRLMARDSVAPQMKGSDPGVTVPVAQRTGQLTIATGSLTEVLPLAADATTLTDEQSFARSRIEGVGRVIHVQGDSLIRSQGGEINLEARTGAAFQTTGTPKAADTRIQVDAGAIVDVSGLLAVPVAVERNYIQVELRGDQLKDSPLQRNTFLYKSKVWVDVEQGTPLANVQANIAKLERTVAEKSATGGDITLKSEGDLVLQAGATLDVSGGSLAYQAGYGKTTQLSLNGQVVDIGTADPEQIYDGFADQYSVADPKWGVTRTWDMTQARYIPAYTAGRSAGQVSLTAHNMVVDATLLGGSIQGTYQRQSAPAGGKLALALLAESGMPMSAAPDLSFVSTRLQAAQTGLMDALPQDMTLSTEFLSQGGFNRLSVATQGAILLPDSVTLDAGPRGDVQLTGRRLDIDGDIITPGGSISLTSRTGLTLESLDAADYGIRIGSGARLDVSGQWVNDLPDSGPLAGSGPVNISGGSITLTSHGDLDLASGSLLDASGGAWWKSNGKLVYGAAGSIRLATGGFGQLNASDPMTRTLHLGGELRAYGLEKGGTLVLETSSLYLGNTPSGQAGELALDEAFFNAGGFRAFELTGVDGVRVEDGFLLSPTPLAAELRGDARLYASGTPMAGLTTRVERDADRRSPTRVSLTAESLYRGDVQVGEGALIRVDPEGEIAITAGRQLTVMGTLEAPAGQISLNQTALLNEEKDLANFEAGRAIFLGADSRLLAQGHYRAVPNDQGLRKGEVLDGGSVDINAAKGYLITQAGSLIDVSGTQTTLDLVARNGLTATQVASNGGRINLAAREGMLLEGDLAGKAGGGQARGGSLNLNLDRQGPNWFFLNTAHPLYAALNSQRVITLQSSPTTLTAGLAPGDALDPLTLNGQARLAVEQVQAGGFADLSLESENRIAFAGTLDLDLDGHLSLLAANLSASASPQVTLSAASVLMGNPDPARQEESWRNDAIGGTGTLAVNADLIELVGHSNLQGFGQTTLASTGDIRLRGVVYDADPGPQLSEVDYVYRGALATGGDLNLVARQIYPASMAGFALEVHNNPSGRITVAATGTEGPVLSAGGSLSLSAPFIEQGGVLKAPFGAITLKSETITRTTQEFGINGLPTGQTPTVTTRTATAEGEVRLTDGSLTSVSGKARSFPWAQPSCPGPTGFTTSVCSRNSWPRHRKNRSPWMATGSIWLPAPVSTCPAEAIYTPMSSSVAQAAPGTICCRKTTKACMPYFPA
jgi:filamentous hemagglutinin